MTSVEPELDPVVKRWGHAQCHALTLAMHEQTGWPILTLHAGNLRMGDRYLDQCGMLVHSGVLSPGGDFIDIYGRHSPDDLRIVEERYLGDPDNARWSHDLKPDVDDLMECLDHHELVEAAISDAYAVIKDRLTVALGPHPSPVAVAP